MKLSENATALLTAYAKGYKVDKFGNVISPFNRKNLKLKKSYYLNFTVLFKNTYKNVNVHRLQAYQKYGYKIFEPGICVMHKDGNPLNNSWDNIIIGTHKENMKDREKHGTLAKGIKNGKNKLTEKEIKEIYKSNLSHRELARKYKITISNVSYIKNGDTWGHLTKNL